MARSGTRIRTTVAFVVALCFSAACSSSGTAGPSRTTLAATQTTAATATSVAAPAGPSTTVALTPAGTTYGVGRSDLTLVDDSRGTDADPDKGIAAEKTRTLPTVVLYPTTDPADDATTDTAPVAPGRFPLLVFSHGVTASGPAYVGILKGLAAAGYVVALPTFPLTSGKGGWNHIDQTVNQPADVSFIISDLLERSAGTKDRLAGHLSPDAVAVGGHSLGAITSLLFFNTCCRDARVRAVVAVSGVTFPGKTDTDDYDDPPKVPLLMLHGEQDTTLAYDAGSRKIFDSTLATLPRALVSFPEAGHTDLLVSPSFMPAIIDFLDLTLRDDPTGWTGLGKLEDENGDATVEVTGGLASTGG